MSQIDYRRALISENTYEKHLRTLPYEVAIPDPEGSDIVDQVIAWLNTDLIETNYNCRMYYSRQHKQDFFVIWFRHREDALTCKLRWGGR